MTTAAMGRAEREAFLVARAREGDIAAWGHLASLHQADVYRTARVIARSGDEAEDVTRDALVRAYRALPTFRDGTPLRPWLLRIVAGVARDRRRDSGRQAPMGARTASPVVPASWESPAPGGRGAVESALPLPGALARGALPGASIGVVVPAIGRPLQREEQELLVAAIDGLPEDDRLVICLRHLCALPDEEIAMVMGTRTDTIAARRRQALERLRGRLGAAR